MAHYECVRQEDGSILASKVEFEHAEMEPGEAKLWERLIPKFKDADTLSSKPAELHILRSRYKIVPIKEAQDYIQKLGESLVPAHERDRQPKDPLKISFRFYLVEDKSLEVLAYPNGIIIVKSELFDTLENEAQLAFFQSNAIAQVVERDIWRISQYQKDARILTSAGATIGWVPGIGALDAPFAIASIATGEMFNRYVDSLADQANRVGLEWMLAAGYDLREAPRAYKAYVLKNPDQPEYSPTYDSYQADKNKQFAALRSNLMAKLRTTYFQTTTTA
ncbi:MAG TPA: hypothetical protein VNE63_23850 [Candidatus Acidoferrales bacterium]|nr:hypothetical protein [Candidatus Acidoferrales bacterium]